MDNKHRFLFLHEWLGENLVQAKIPIQGISDDSRNIQPGDVFIDMSESMVDSALHIRQAVERGAVAVLTSHSKHSSTTLGVYVCVIHALKEHISSLAATFYGQPSQKMQLVAITGTNGKTTTALLMLQAAQALGIATGYIGTLGYGQHIKDFMSTGLTTPSAFTVQKILYEMYQAGIQLVIMEVSSHAVVQHRVAACSFDVAIFTNLSRDHLDYHHSMFDYAQAKKKLFTQHKVFNSIINIDDPVGQQFEAELQQSVIPFTFHATQSTRPAVQLHLDYSDKRGIALHLESPWGKGVLVSRLMGSFNAYNLASAWLGLTVLGFPLLEVSSALSTIHSIPGRFEIYRPSQLKPMVVVDYAHTPSALEVVLEALRALTNHHVWVVFGCGGNRDKGKRALMGQVAERLADRVILTTDNPRDEDPEAIIADILKGMICPWAVEIEVDRAVAIKRAVGEAKAGDIVLVAGKGHEVTQKVKNTVTQFEDKAHVLNALGMQEEHRLRHINKNISRLYVARVIRNTLYWYFGLHKVFS